jgi:methylmalonyl-CoA mutase
MSNSQEKKLFQEFPPVSREEWEAVIQKDLKGADYQKKLVWKTTEGIDVKPYYREDDLARLGLPEQAPGAFPFIRGKHTDGQKWLIRQDIVVDDTARAGQKAASVITKGAESIGFIIPATKKLTENEVNQLLQSICLNEVEVNFLFEGMPSGIVELFLNEAKRRADRNLVRASFGYDPLGEMLVTGKNHVADGDVFELLKTNVLTSAEYPAVRVIQVNGQHFQNAGSSIVQELGFSLAAGNEYMSRLREKSLSTDQVASSMSFCFAIGSNYFMEIAKIRAARLLWAKLIEAWGGSEESAMMHIHAITSRFNKSVYDPHVNMLRTTTEAMSAILGGADSVTVEPFDLLFKNQPGDLSERIARNTQIVLREEAYLNKISDPAAGSYYIESLTASIAAEAWKLFLETEDQGGFTEAFRTEFIQSQIESVAKKRVDNLAARSETLLGLNQYPNSREKVSASIEKEIFSAEKDQGEFARPVRIFRMAEELEKMRLKTEKSARAPVVFLLTIGDVTMRRARAGFSSNFFGCAGFEVIDNIGFENIQEGMQAAEQAKADIIVLCSSDGEYPAVTATASQLNKHSILVIAGYPKESIDQLTKDGAKYFIHMRSNLVETLTMIQNDLGIQ